MSALINGPTTYPSFSRKINRTIGPKTPVRPFDLSNFKGKGQQLSSNPDFPGLDGKHGIHVVEKDSKSKREIKPVHWSPMFTGKNNNKPAGPSGIFNHGHQEKKIMINKKYQTGRTSGKTETKTTNQKGGSHE